LTDAMQLGELLQETSVRVPSLRGRVDWLRTRIAQADDNDEAAQLRLESDAHCVQILTLHKSKGLEFPLVYLPFAAIGGQDRKPQRHCEYHDDAGRVLRLAPASDDDPSWQAAIAAWRTEETAEDARLLYVGLTRAQYAVWLASGPLYASATTPLAAMLADPESLRAIDGIAIDARALPDAAPVRLSSEIVAAPPPARTVQRALRRDWWVYSFSSLQREPAGGESERGDERGAADENAVADGDARFAGTRFGNALHAALEGVDFARWREASADVPPPGDETILAVALRREGYADADLVEGLPLLARMIRATLQARLPEGVRLCDLPTADRRAEMEFHFAMASVDIENLIALLHAHGLARDRSGFGSRRRIEGLMTGRIDLVYAHAGRFHVLDYKSNRLPDYGADALAAAMRESEYDLQALIYTLALHRWLRFRLGAAYDYESHVGGARYLFCRGLDAPGAGIHAWRPTRELIEALDGLFGAGTRSAA
jgi:exodeoxyribonuclease V beta subunit